MKNIILIIILFTSFMRINAQPLGNNYLSSACLINDKMYVMIGQVFTSDLTNSNGSLSFGDQSIFLPTIVGINNIHSDKSNQIMSYPNPAKDELNLEFKDLKETSLIASINDINGNTVMKQKISNVQNKVKLNISSLSPGSYIINFKSNNSSSFLNSINFIKIN